MSKAVDIFSGILFVRTRHYDDVKKVVVLQGNKPERRFFEERPQGDWINRKHYQVDEDGYDTMTCNKCGKEIDLPRMEDYYFCPICGAKMKQGES